MAVPLRRPALHDDASEHRVPRAGDQGCPHAGRRSVRAGRPREADRRVRASPARSPGRARVHGRSVRHERRSRQAGDRLLENAPMRGSHLRGTAHVSATRRAIVGGPAFVMDHATLETMKRSHPGWRLLAADHAPMIISFLHATFIQPNVRTMAQQALCARLDDWLYQLRQREGAESYPRSASQYLDTWADDAHAWLASTTRRPVTSPGSTSRRRPRRRSSGWRA